MAGLIHIYCGDGKGKTTAAMGLSIRAAGRGIPVVIVQFLKSSETGELNSLKQIPNIRVVRSSERMGFTFQMNDQEKEHAKQIQQDLFLQAEQAAFSGLCGLLILDEIMAACSCGMVQEQQVLELLQNKPAELELVLTGRNPPDSFVNLADYVSEIHKRKHPFDQGIGARDGIEQ